MNGMTNLVLIVATLGWLVLAIGGFRAERVSGRKALRMAAVWLGIILGLVLLLKLLGVSG